MFLQPFSPLEVPLLNSLLLLSSGVTVTVGHHYAVLGEAVEARMWLERSVVLGALFTYLQWCEYMESLWTIKSSCYGSIFFVATGFHGAHVLAGGAFLQLASMWVPNQSRKDLMSFELAAWYWHFVDLV